MNRFIIADASKCIGCRTCEVACVVSHQENQDCASLTPETFLPRIHVIKGVNISTATVCRQCEDAPCANVCPNGAISRDKADAQSSGRGRAAGQSDAAERSDADDSAAS